MSNPSLNRTLEARHLQMIAIGGVIGAGFFMGAGKTLALAGVSVLLVYLIVGVFVFITLRAMGELLLSNTGYRSFLDAIAMHLGPLAAFVVGWTYWLSWIVIAVANTVAVTGYMRFWWPQMPLWVPTLCNAVFALALNLLQVKWFGKAESALTLIKIATICVIIILGGILVAKGVTYAGHTASLSHLLDPDNLMPYGWMGFFAAFQLAVQAQAGAELIGTAAAETQDVRYHLPRAINKTPVRIVLFFVLSLAVILMVIPLSAINANQSPFVQMFSIIGLGFAAGAVNFVALLAALSSSSSGIYCASRMIYSLAGQGVAPKAFLHLNRNQIPYISVLYSGFYLSLCFVLLYGTSSIMDAFTLISTFSSTAFLFIWMMILTAYLHYRKQAPALHQKSPYPLIGGRGLSWVALGFFGLILCLFGLKEDTRLALMLMPLWFLGLCALYHVRYRPQTRAENR